MYFLFLCFNIVQTVTSPIVLNMTKMLMWFGNALVLLLKLCVSLQAKHYFMCCGSSLVKIVRCYSDTLTFTVIYLWLIYQKYQRKTCINLDWWGKMNYMPMNDTHIAHIWLEIVNIVWTMQISGVSMYVIRSVLVKRCWIVTKQLYSCVCFD